MKVTTAYLVLLLILPLKHTIASTSTPSTNPTLTPLPTFTPLPTLTPIPTTSTSTPKPSLPPKLSIYGVYNPASCCWKKGPSAPRLRVGYQCQSEIVRRKIEYMLSQNAAVGRAVSKNVRTCESNHWGSEGLADNCPSSYHRATEVRLWDKKCYIVRPNQQCVTFRNCYPKQDCGTGGIVIDGRSIPHGPITRRSERSKGGTCDGISLSSSTCLPDGYRTFQAWIYCDFCGFKLVNLELPQCCSCKRYKRC